MKFIFTNYAKKQFLKLDIKIQTRIKNKLLLLKSDKDLLKNNIKNIVNMQPITHRVKIGSHRLLLQKDSENYIVLKVGHRKNIYM